MKQTPENPSKSCADELRVLYVIPGKDHGVGMSFSRRQAEDVRSQGVNVRSFYLKSRTAPVTVARELVRLRGEIKSFEPHVIHAHFGTMTAFLCAIATRVPLVITFHGSDLNPAPGISWIRSFAGRTLSRLAARRASQVICVSPQLQSRIQDLGTEAHVVPCGINLELFQPLSMAECREKLGWHPEERIVLFNARTDPIGKRLDLAEACVEKAQKSISNLRLHIFRGRTDPDDMPLYYSAADALLVTSDYEGSPLVVKEAMACNLPVISVDVGDVRARLFGVEQSDIVARDPVALSQSLARILTTPGRSNGRERMIGLSGEAIAKQVIAIYEKAIGRKKVTHKTNDYKPLAKAS